MSVPRSFGCRGPQNASPSRGRAGQHGLQTAPAPVSAPAHPPTPEGQRPPTQLSPAPPFSSPQGPAGAPGPEGREGVKGKKVSGATPGWGGHHAPLEGVGVGWGPQMADEAPDSLTPTHPPKGPSIPTEGSFSGRKERGGDERSRKMGVPTAAKGSSSGGLCREEFWGRGGLLRLCWPAQLLLCWCFHPGPEAEGTAGHKSGEGTLEVIQSSPLEAGGS